MVNILLGSDSMPKEMNIKDAVKVEQNAIQQRNASDLEKTVKYLEQMREDKANIYVKFQGHRLYSASVTIESAFLDIYGYTHEDYLKYGEKTYPNATFEQREKLDSILEGKAKRYREAKKKEAELLFEYTGSDTRRLVEFLQDCKRDNRNVCVDYKGCRLYSEFVTFDDAVNELVKAKKERQIRRAAELEQAEKETKIWKPGTKVKPIKGAKKLTEEEPEL